MVIQWHFKTIDQSMSVAFMETESTFFVILYTCSITYTISALDKSIMSLPENVVSKFYLQIHIGYQPYLRDLDTSPNLMDRSVLNLYLHKFKLRDISFTYVNISSRPAFLLIFHASSIPPTWDEPVTRTSIHVAIMTPAINTSVQITAFKPPYVKADIHWFVK